MFGLLTSLAGVVIFILVLWLPWAATAFGVVAAVCVVDLAWVLHRKRRGEPGSMAWPGAPRVGHAAGNQVRTAVASAVTPSVSVGSRTGA